MDQNLKEKTQEAIAKSQNIAIIASKNAGFDALSSALALYLSLKKLGKTVSIQGPNPTVSDAQNLYAVDKVGDLIENKNFVIAIDNAVDTVDKVTYYLDKNILKIVVHPLPESPSIQKEQIHFEKSIQQSDLMFLIGFDSKEKLSQEYTPEQLNTSKTWIVSVSTKIMDKNFVQMQIVNDQSSLSELTASLIQLLSLPIDEDISFNLYNGIQKSTHNFSPAKTEMTTFQIAAWLVKFGAGKASFAQQEFQQSNQNELDNTQSTQQEEPTVFQIQSSIDDIEQGPKEPETDWLKPPKIYKGSKSVDTE